MFLVVLNSRVNVGAVDMVGVAEPVDDLLHDFVDAIRRLPFQIVIDVPPPLVRDVSQYWQVDLTRVVLSICPDVWMPHLGDEPDCRGFEWVVLREYEFDTVSPLCDFMVSHVVWIPVHAEPDVPLVVVDL